MDTNEKLLNYLSENSIDWIWEFDENELFTYTSKGVRNILGYTPEEVLGKSAFDFIPSPGREKVKEEFGVLKEERQPFSNLENVNLHKNGSLVTLESSGVPIIDSEGVFRGYRGIDRDITERKRSEEMVRESEKNFRTFVETIDDIVLVSKLDGSIIYSNPSASSKLGFNQNELCKKKLIELHPPYLQKEAAKIVSEMISGNQDVCPLPVLGKNGNLIPVETHVWFGKWNGEECVFGLSKDLSREQEAFQKFDRIFRMNPALMAVSELSNQTFTDVNDAFLQTLGYSKEEIIGKSLSDLNVVANIKEQKQASKMLYEYGQIREIEMQVRTKQGDIRYGLFSGDIIENQGIKYSLTVMVDITERRQAEIELKKSIQELRIALSEIKTLRGIVPICANCKNIRDDTGYWGQVEAYVSKYTEAQFSHSICPECIPKLYPNLGIDEDTDITK